MIQSTLRQQLTQKKLHRLLLSATAICSMLLTQAQAPAKTAPAHKSTTYPTTQDTSKVMDVREKLVQLAMQNPNYEIADRNVAIANDQVKKSKAAWLNQFSAQGNLNEFSFNPPTNPNGTSANYFYPRYNVGVTVPFDLFITKKNDVRIAKQNLGIAQAQKNERFREIKAEVLTVYEDYLLYKQHLEFQSQIVQDAESVYLQAEKDFSDGIIKQEDYNRAFKGRAQEKTLLAETLHAYNISKINLEKLIGVPIESVINNQ